MAQNKTGTWGHDHAFPDITSGGMHVRVTAQEADVATLQDSDRFSIGTATGSVDTWDISWADEVHVIIDSDGTTDALSVYSSHDGTNFSPTPVNGRTSAAGGAYVAASITGDLNLTIPFNGKKLRFTKAGTTDTVTVSWSARNSGRSAV